MPHLFSYRSIIEPDGIRLVLLHPAKDIAAQLECSVEHTTLSHCDQDLIYHYIALSYVWGDPEDTRSIVVGGCSFTITANLDSALRHVRDTEKIIRVWADAICIDQTNVVERNQQVQQMGSVYSVARHTIIYLGDSSSEETFLFDQLRSLCAGSYVPRFTVDLATKIGSMDLEALRRTLEVRLLSRPWFTRVWILQELLLSRDPWVQLESRRMRWNDFYQISSSISDKVRGPLSTEKAQKALLDWESDSEVAEVAIVEDPRLRLSDGVGAIKRLEYMQSARQRFHDYIVGNGAGNDLLAILSWRRGMGISDARDMIYAHLGLMSDSTSGDLKLMVDYTKSSARVFTDAARYVMMQHNNWDILSHVEDVDPQNRLPGLPSWAPDWTSKDTHDPRETEPCRRLVSFPPTRSFALSTKGEPEILCRGMIYERIGEVGTKVLAFAHLNEDQIVRAWHGYSRRWDENTSFQMVAKDCAEAAGFPTSAAFPRALTDCFPNWKDRLKGLFHDIKMGALPEEMKTHPIALNLAAAFLVNPLKRGEIYDPQFLEGRRVCQFETTAARQRGASGFFEAGDFWEIGLQSGTFTEIALVPQWTQLGDLIGRLEGEATKFVFRPVERDHPSRGESVNKHLKFVGICYVSRQSCIGAYDQGAEEPFVLK